MWPIIALKLRARLFNTPLRTLDALHLAIASLEEFELVTSDQQLVQAATVLGVKIRTLN